MYLSQLVRQFVKAYITRIHFLYTPYHLIELVRPDVLVKGGDYKPEEIVGREFAKKVVRFALLKGRSTTNIIKKVSK